LVALIAAWGTIAGALHPAAQQRDATAPEQSTAVNSLDLNGNNALSERVVTHRSQSEGREEVVIETYSPSIQWGRLALSRRVRRVTTVTSGGSETIEETEAVNNAEPSAPLRVVQRIVTTVHRNGDDSYVTERQVFDLDLNGRLVLSRTEHSSSW
jgi:hypothetical protein